MQKRTSRPSRHHSWSRASWPAAHRGGGLVLDPFAGAGTTILVALRLGRRGLGVELNPDYVTMARERIIADAPLLNGAPT